MSQLSFNHLLNLSFAFHTRRKTGEILRVLDRGAAINHTLEVSFSHPHPFSIACLLLMQLILFNIVPTFIDILVALVAFCIIFKWTLALVLFFVMFAYGLCQGQNEHFIHPHIFIVSVSVILTRWRTQLKRQMNERDIVSAVVGLHGQDF